MVEDILSSIWSASHLTKDGVKSPYRKPPILRGYTYSGEEAYSARDAGRLLSIRLETNRSCNLNCRYCYAQSGRSLDDELAYDVLAEVVLQAAELGAASVVVIGGGEPTIYPRFAEMIELIASLGMVPVVFTNTMNMDADLAAFLYARGASVMGKLDSLRPQVQDFLAGREGAAERMQRGLECLMEAGFVEAKDAHELRLGASFVSNKANLDEIETIWHWCRERGIFPNMEVLTPTGRAQDELAGYALAEEEIKEYKLRLLEADRRDYGYDWLPFTPLTASGCLQHLYSLYITIEGDVRPCAPTKLDEHPDLKVDGVYPYNVKRMGLADIYKSELFEYIRHIDQHLEGKCSGCEHLGECIGCRGYAYAVGANKGLEPRAALRSECLQCFK
ncbi:MAG: radical SAM protein [Phycisphaerae bacterium]|nr:radical SAM protein [Phycisphaerae bacterium]